MRQGILRLRRGLLRSRVTILQPIVSTGVRTWASFITVWAEVQPMADVDRPAGLAPPDIITSEVRMHYIPGIKPRMRLSMAGGRTLEIIAVMNVLERNHTLILTAKEV